MLGVKPTGLVSKSCTYSSIQTESFIRRKSLTFIFNPQQINSAKKQS